MVVQARERPILFSDDMVLAILEGRKTETRRPVKPQPPLSHWAGHEVTVCGRDYRCPYGAAGDRLWVRETWATQAARDAAPPRECHGAHIHYRADGISPHNIMALTRGRWRRSIHMPRWASRLTLQVDEVRIEPLHDIDYAGCRAEGFAGHHDHAVDYPINPAMEFVDAWDALYAKHDLGWDDNPSVWVVRFHVVEGA